VTPQELIAAVTVEYEHQLIRNPQTTRKSGNAGLTAGSSAYTGQHSATKNITCYNCNKTSHFKSDCWTKGGVRGHPSIPLLPLFLTMSICIPHGLYTYPTTSMPLWPPCDNWCSSLISWYLTILPTSSQPWLMPQNYHRPHWGNVTWPYGTLRWSSDFHIWKAWY
jgi:hypothetical protein